jgi:uncharacterized protein YutD
MIKLNNTEYELIKNYKDSFNLNDIENIFTDYFYDYDYIVGDYSCGKLRLKGFCNPENKLFRELNDKNNIEEYIKKDCAYDCGHYILERKI